MRPNFRPSSCCSGWIPIRYESGTITLARGELELAQLGYSSCCLLNALVTSPVSLKVKSGKELCESRFHAIIHRDKCGAMLVEWESQARVAGTHNVPISVSILHFVFFAFPISTPSSAKNTQKVRRRESLPVNVTDLPGGIEKMRILDGRVNDCEQFTS